MESNNRRRKGKSAAAAPRRRVSPPQHAGDFIVKEMTLSSLTQSTSAGSIVPVTTSVDTSLVQTAPAAEFASFAARYQQYRVRKCRVIVRPCYPSTIANAGIAANESHSSLYVADYIGTATPSTAAQICSDERSVVHSTADKFTYEVTWARNPNAKLWNPTNAVIPAANTYGIAWASSTDNTLLPTSKTIFTYTVEWEVEFRGSQ